MINPMAKDLIAGAIGESGALLGAAPQPLAMAEKIGADFAESAGAPTLAALRAMPAQQLLDATKKPGTWFFAVQDGYVLPNIPTSMYADGKQARIPLLAGWNSHEGHYKQILGESEPTTESFAAALQKLYGDQAAAAQQALSLIHI